MENKYKDALDKLKHIESEHTARTGHPCSDILQELVDKETPLKTIHFISKEGYETHLCGRCRSRVGSPYEPGSYCEICGQKIEFDLKLTNYKKLPKNEKIIVLGIRRDE